MADDVTGSGGVLGPETAVSNLEPLIIEEQKIRISKNTEIVNYAPSGSTNEIIMSVNINSGNYSNILTGFSLTNTGDAIAGIDVTNLKLWLDNGLAVNEWDSGDIYVCTIAWDAVSSKWTNNNIGLSSNLQLPGRNFVLTINITSNANAGREFYSKILKNNVKGSGNIIGPSIDIVNIGSLTIEEELIYIIKNMDITNFVPPDSANVSIMAININSGHYSNILTGFSLTNTGDAVETNDYINVKIWLDNGLSVNEWDSGDSYVCTLGWDTVSSKWTNNNIALTSNLEVPGENFIITVDITSNATTNRKIYAKIPKNGVTGSGIIGPLTDISNTGALTIFLDFPPHTRASLEEGVYFGTTSAIM